MRAETSNHLALALLVEVFAHTYDIYIAYFTFVVHGRRLEILNRIVRRLTLEIMATSIRLSVSMVQ